jgi:biotin carboxyl carrier protein
VLRKPGDAVREGEGVVLVELMGMENEIRSPRDGKVVELLVQEGQAVEKDARVASVE